MKYRRLTQVVFVVLMVVLVLALAHEGNQTSEAGPDPYIPPAYTAPQQPSVEDWWAQRQQEWKQYELEQRVNRLEQSCGHLYCP